MDPELKTFRDWMREGRCIRKGSIAEFYLTNEHRTSARALFRRDQTDLLHNDADDAELEGWTDVISAADWEQHKAEKRELARRPYVKLRRLDEGGVAVWCGPDKDIIKVLREHNYRYDPKTRYWTHPNKDAEKVALGFEQGRIRDAHVRVRRDWDVDANERPDI